MVYKLEDTSKVEKLFDGWQETLIYSCLQKVMGKIFVTDLENPVSAFALVGILGFFAGAPDEELVKNKVTRFAIRKDTKFDVEKLKKNLEILPDGYELKNIDGEIYDLCLENPVTADFVSAFESKEKYLEDGMGAVILKDGKIVSGASSYTRYKEGIEIEVDTIESERRKHLATVACSALILRCLDEGLYPSWDAQNMGSVHLSEKLGYEFDHEYIAYEVSSNMRTH